MRVVDNPKRFGYASKTFWVKYRFSSKEMPNKPTLKSLATELGLSITTVSRALAGYSDVSPATRERVRLAAEQAAYVPNQSARRLVTGRSNAIGMVMPYPADQNYDPYVNDPFINELLRHIAHALQRLPHLDLIVGYAHSDQDLLSTYKRFVQGRRVDAFFIARTYTHDERVDYLLDQGIPFVCHGRTQHADRHAWVDTDAKRGFAEATQHFLNLQHERIALLNIPDNYYTARLRADGYSEAMQSAGLEAQAIPCELRMQSAYEAALALLQGSEPPSALLCASDILAVGAMQALRALGYTPGQEVSVIGADNLPLARLLEPDLASMTYSYEHLGEVMVNMLHQQLLQDRILPEHQLMQFQLIKRESLGAYTCF